MNTELRDRLFVAVLALVSLLERNHQRAIEWKSIVDSNAALTASIVERSTNLEAKVQFLSIELAASQDALVVSMASEKASVEETAIQKASSEELSLKIAEMTAIDETQIAAIQTAQLLTDEATAKLAILTDESAAEDAKIGELLDTVQASIDANSN